MAFVNMDSPIFYAPPAKVDLRRSTSVASSPSIIGRGEAGQLMSRSADETEPSDSVTSLQRGPPGLLCTPKPDGEIKSWDNIIPLSCRNNNDRAQRPSFHRLPGISSKVGVSDEPAVGRTAGEPIEVESSDESSSDESADGKTTVDRSTSASSPVFGTSQEEETRKVKTDQEGCEVARGSGAEVTSIQDQTDDIWLDIETFPDFPPDFKDSDFGVEHSQTGPGERSSGPEEIKDGQSERELQKTDKANEETEKQDASALVPDSEAVRPDLQTKRLTPPNNPQLDDRSFSPVEDQTAQRFTQRDDRAADTEGGSESRGSKRVRPEPVKKKNRRVLFSDDDGDDEAEVGDMEKTNISQMPPGKKRRGQGSKKSASTTGRAQRRPHTLVEGQEWEIKEIVDRRNTSGGYQYKVVWASSWLPRGELGNTKRLLRKFEAKRPALY